MDLDNNHICSTYWEKDNMTSHEACCTCGGGEGILIDQAKDWHCPLPGESWDNCGEFNDESCSGNCWWGS